MATIPTADINRIEAANGDAYDETTNPDGLANGGHRQNFVPDLQAVVGVAQWAADSATEAAAFVVANQDLVDDLNAVVVAAQDGPVITVNGMSGIVVIPAAPAVLAPVNSSPVAGSTPSLNGGALTLAVAGFLPLYPKTQKSIRFQLSASTSFSSTLYDSGQITTTGLSTSLANAQSLLTGGTTYYMRAQQTDQDNFTSAWSSTTSFIFPRLPNAPTMSVPANNATGVGAQNQPITLTASNYVHPNGTAQAARRFELSKDNFATIVTVAGTVGQASATIASPKDVLTANTPYKVRAVDTDTNGGVATGAATTFTTVAQFKPAVGQAYEGGFLGPQFGDGNLFDLVVAAKSTEASRPYGGNNNTQSSFSRLNGLDNTAKIINLVGNSPSTIAAAYATSTQIGGVSGYLAALDEARAIAAVLRPAIAPAGSPFVVGGSEAYPTGIINWTSSETTSTTAWAVQMGTGSEEGPTAKTTSVPLRPIKRLAVTPPIALGTYVAAQGGWAWFYFTDLSSGVPITYLMFKSDKSVEVTRAWDTGSNGSTGMTSRTSGPLNEAKSVNVASPGALAAIQYCSGLVHNGKDDFYLPAIDELLTGARMNDQLPSAQRLTAANYFSSTEITASAVQGLTPLFAETNLNKAGNSFGVIPIRRVPITSL